MAFGIKGSFGKSPSTSVGVVAELILEPLDNGTSVVCNISVPYGELSSWDLDVRPVGGSWLTVENSILSTSRIVTGLFSESAYEFRAIVRIMSEVTDLSSTTTLEAPPDPVLPYTQVEINAYLASNAAYDGNDTISNYAATESSEIWNNTSAWTTFGQSPVVSSGKLRGNGGGGLSFILKPFGSIQYMATTIEIQASNGDDGHTFVGVGGSFPEGLSGCYGFSINGGSINRVVNGSLTSFTSTTINTKYFIEIYRTSTHISISILGENDIRGGTITVALSGALTHYVLFNSDGLGASGKLIGPVDLKNSISRMVSPVVTSHYSMLASDPSQSTYRWRAAFPKTFVPTATHDVVIVFHGLGTTSSAWFDLPSTDTNYPLISQTLLDAGYVVISADDPRSSSTWGNSNTISAYHQAYLAIRELVNVGGLYVVANSMGGIEALNAISRAAVPADAMFATSATASLLSCYEGLFASDIMGSYGGNYTNTVDYDPLIHVSGLFNRVKAVSYYWATPSDDSSVDPSENSVAMHNRLIAAGSDTTLDLTTGGHGFSFTGPWPGKLTTFLAAH